MKSFTAKFLKLLLTAILVVTFSNQVANACLQIIHATQGANDLMCRGDGEDANWCYYICECTGNCDAMYDQLGLEAY